MVSQHGPAGGKPGRRTGVTSKRYQELVQAYMAHPGRHKTVANLTGFNYRTCKKAWELGLDYDFARTPLSQIVTKTNADVLALDRFEQEVARQERGASRGAANDTGDGGAGSSAVVPTDPEALNEAAVQAGIKRLVKIRLEELELLALTRKNAISSHRLLDQLLTALTVPAQRAAEAITKWEAGPLPDDVKDTLGLLMRLGVLTRSQSQVTRTVLAGEAIVLTDLRTSIAKGETTVDREDEDPDDMTDEAVVEEFEREAAESAKQAARIRARLEGAKLAVGSAPQAPAASPPSTEGPSTSTVDRPTTTTPPPAEEPVPHGQGRPTTGAFSYAAPADDDEDDDDA